MVIFAVVAGGVSVAELFLAGIFPGIMVGVVLLILCYILSVIRKYPISSYMTPKERVIAFGKGILPLTTVLIIMGGVSFGFFTATEAAAIACLYASILTFGVYRKISIKQLYPIMIRTLRTLAMVLCLIAAASAFSSLMTRLQVPGMLTNALLTVSDNPLVIYFLIIVMLLVMSTVMDMAPMILIMTPILMPVVTSLGMDPVHFGVILIFSLGIGMITPPVGTVLFTVTAIGKITVEKASKALVPMYIVLILALLVVTYVPAISMWLPSVIRN
jgi:tripartite ATP-independent transporter DctM subunit